MTNIKEEVLKEVKKKNDYFWKEYTDEKPAIRERMEESHLLAISLTQQKMIKEFKEMIDKKLEGFKKVRQGIIGNTKVLTAYNCFIAHLEELKSQVEKT